MVRFIKYSHAFTLLEVVLYLALFSIITTGVVRTVYTLLETRHEADVALAIQNDGSFVLQKIAWALGDVDSISTHSSTSLEIVRRDTATEPITFFVQDNRWYMKQGEGEASPLTAAVYRVHDVLLTVSHPTPESNYLKVSFFIDDAPFSLAWPQYE